MKSSTLTRTASEEVSLSPQDKFLAQRTKQLIGGLAVALSLSLLTNGKAEAASFSFTRIVDASSSTNLASDYASSSFNGEFGSAPVINDSGLVAFWAGLNYQGSTITNNSRGIFTGNGTTITPIAPIGDYLHFSDTLSINNNGTVAFLETTLDFILWRGNGQSLTQFRGTGGSTCFGLPMAELDINDAGVVVFGGYEPVRSCGEILTTSLSYQPIAAYFPGSNLPAGFLPWYNFNLSPPSINNSGTVAFTAGFFNSPRQPTESIFLYKGGLDYIPIVSSGGFFKDFGGGLSYSTYPGPPYPLSFFLPISRTPIINDNDTVAFFANLKAGGSGIFTHSGGNITTIANTSGSFVNFGKYSLNNSGSVAFAAGLQGGGYGIFTGANPVTDKVIAVGDSLFGSTVTSLGFSSQGLNNSGQVAFWAALANGSFGIFRADLTSQTPVTESVPEPISVLSLLAFGALGAGSLRQRHRKRQA